MPHDPYALPMTDDGLSRFVPPSPRQILRICMNLKHLIDEIIPIQFDDKVILSPDSKILNHRVIQLVLEAAGGIGNGKPGSSSRKYRASLVFALLKVTGWYWELASFELHDSELYYLRAATAQHLAKLIIERETDDNYLFIQMLCHRYVINANTEDTDPINAVELASDMHSTIVIGSEGFQRCIKWLWRGWIVQSAKDPSSYVLCRDISKTSIVSHFDPDRIKTPLYQNILEIFFSVIYLMLFTLVVNQSERGVVPLDFVEIAYYFFTLAYVYDELVKVYHIGLNYLSFFSVLNDSMYAIVLCSIVLRFMSLSKPHDSETAISLDLASFRVLSLSAPLMYIRLLLYLDAQRFVGAMIVVMKLMMKESIVFFFLLAVVILGFLQGFLGLDSADGRRDATSVIVTNLARTVLGAGDFDAFEGFVPPYSDILYYFYSFLVSVILLNLLIALYASAYDKIIENAVDEYLALVTSKTLRYIRAPDVAVFVPPLNLIELMISPLCLFMSKKAYTTLSYRVMLVIYSPFLFYISIRETRDSRRIQYNRMKGLSDDANEVDREWDLGDGYDDSFEGIFATTGAESSESRNNEDLRAQLEAERQDPDFNVKKEWFAKVKRAAPPITRGNDVGVGWDVFPLYDKVDALSKLVERLVQENKELKEVLKSKD